MQRWEYKVVSLRDRQYTAALNEFGRDGWELINVTTEALEATTTPERGRGIPMPRVLGRLEEAADKLNKLGTADADADASPDATSRLLWVFRRPLADD
jgi:hypothetical protein